MHFKSYILIFFVSFFVYSCEKVIDVDLNEANQAVVIEGNLNNENGELKVSISKTGSYFGNDAMENISNANVVFKHHTGELITINEISTGVYADDHLLVRPGNMYELIVELNGEKYTAESFLNEPVTIDSVAYSYFNGNGFFDGGYRVKLYFSDPPESDNYYRIKVYKNSELQNDVNDLIVFDDSAINGKTIEVTLRGQSFADGDKARVELITLDENAFEYFSTLRDLINTNPGSPAPANPISNFSNGALGYFSAWSNDSKFIEIKK
jgi:hypothetical protein